MKKENTIKHIEIFKKYLHGNKQALDGFVKELEPLLNQNEDHKYILQTIKMGIEVSKTVMKWSNNAIKEIEEK